MRDPAVAALADATRAAIATRRPPPDIEAAAGRVFARLAERAGVTRDGAGEGLPVCDNLGRVWTSMAAGGDVLAALGRSVAALAPRLTWERRKGSTPAEHPFHDGHANAMVIGPGGIEARDDLWVGLSLLAPKVTYPDHDHPPEEVYLAFTDGEWWNARMPWTRPGPGGLIYNPPGIRHAMRSGPEPFLALWLLPVE